MTSEESVTVKMSLLKIASECIFSLFKNPCAYFQKQKVKKKTQKTIIMVLQGIVDKIVSIFVFSDCLSFWVFFFFFPSEK